MTVITCYTVVRIPGDTLVLVVYFGLVIMCMAIDATKDLVIAHVCMAVGAKCPGTGMMPGIDREILAVMVEGRG